jgi:hypothetical protein
MNTEQLAKQINEPLYRNEWASTAKHKAQRALMGRTPYVDTDTLRWHKARVLEAFVIHHGLFFVVRESVALDSNNGKRGQRGVVFDVWGAIVHRWAAVYHYREWYAAFDPIAYYCAELTRRAEWNEAQARVMRDVVALATPTLDNEGDAQS